MMIKIYQVEFKRPYFHYEKQDQICGGGVGGHGSLFCVALVCVLYLKEMDEFYDDSTHKVRGAIKFFRQHMVLCDG